MRTLSEADLSTIVPDVRRTFLTAKTDEERVDLLGTIRSLEQGLAEIRKEGASEIVPGTRGHRFEFVQGRVAKRSYNTPQLLAKIAATMDRSLWDTFVYLFRNDVIRVSWQWKLLKKMLAEHNVTVVTAQHEIEEGDEADIGEYWKDGYPSYQRVE